MPKKNYLELPDWLKSNVFYRARLNQNSGEWINSDHVIVHPYDANLVSSETISGRHNLLLDLDCEHWYSKSSTYGHGHLAINIQISEDGLKEIVEVLSKYGIVQQGIKRQLDERGHLSLRLPGLKKNSEDDESLSELKAKNANK